LNSILLFASALDIGSSLASAIQVPSGASASSYNQYYLIELTSNQLTPACQFVQITLVRTGNTGLANLDTSFGTSYASPNTIACPPGAVYCGSSHQPVRTFD
jgi:hypothetical protein